MSITFKNGRFKVSFSYLHMDEFQHKMLRLQQDLLCKYRLSDFESIEVEFAFVAFQSASLAIQDGEAHKPGETAISS